jgi:outer membrane protein, heavy metal efflux system
LTRWGADSALIAAGQRDWKEIIMENANRRQAAALALVLSLGGCVTAPAQPTLDSISVTTRAAGLDAPLGDAAQAALEAELEKLLAEPVSARAAVQLALLNSPAVAARLADFDLDRADLIAATRPPLPTLSFERLSANDGPGAMTSLGVAAPLVDLLLWPRRSTMAKSRFEQARLMIAHDLISTANGIWRQYAEAVTAEGHARIAADQAETAALARDLAERFYSAGNITAGTLAQARKRALVEDTAAQQAAQRAGESRASLAIAMGLPKDAAFVLPAGLPMAQPLPDSPQPSERLDLRAARLALSVAGDDARLTQRWAWLGAIEVGASRERSGGVTESGPTLAATLPLFDGGSPARLSARARKAKAAAALAQLELQAGHAARLARTAAETSHAAMVSELTQGLAAHRAVLAEARERFNAMLIGAFDLLDAKQTELAAQARRLDLIKTYWLARADLADALGRTVEPPPADTPLIAYDAPAEPEADHHHGHGESQ